MLVEDIFFQTITSLYLESHGINIHRYDPLLNRDGNDGAEVHCKLFKLNCWLTQCTTQFDVESAINITLIEQSV
jgi:hypothetical protein